MWKGAFSLPASNWRGSSEKLDVFFFGAMQFLLGSKFRFSLRAHALISGDHHNATARDRMAASRK
jgi:hypothetical protein